MGEKVNVDEFGEYILWALSGDDEECIRVACGIVSDIASALHEKVDSYLTTFVPHLLNVLRNAGRDWRTKLQALTTIGDLAIYAGGSFCNLYLNDALIILDSASVLSTRTADYTNDPDVLEYLSELRMGLIETYTTIT